MSSGGCPRRWSCWTSVRGSPERGGALGGSRSSAPHAASATPSRAAQHPRQNTRIIQNIADRGSSATTANRSPLLSRLSTGDSQRAAAIRPLGHVSLSSLSPAAVFGVLVVWITASSRPFCVGAIMIMTARHAPRTRRRGPRTRLPKWSGGSPEILDCPRGRSRKTGRRRASATGIPGTPRPPWARAAGVGPVPAFDPGSNGTDSRA